MNDDSDEDYIQTKYEGAYHLKQDPSFRTFSRPVTKKICIKNIGNSKRFKIIDVAPHNYSIVLHPKINDKIHISPKGGYFSIKKYEKGTRLKLSTKESKKKPSLSIGSKFTDMVELNYKTDGQSSHEMEENVEEITNDIIVLEYQGAGPFFFMKSVLEGTINYLVIDKDIEREILKKEKEKTIDFINEKYNRVNDLDITDHIKRVLKNFFNIF